jgi:hypothetical protein
MATARSSKTSKTSTSGKPSRRVRAARKDAGVTVRPKRSSKKVVTESTDAATEVVKRKRWQRTPKSERPVYPKLPNVLQLTVQAYRLLARNWKLFLGIAIVYGALNILLVRGISGGASVADIKSQFSQLQSGTLSSLGILASLITSSNSTGSDAANAYQSFLVLTTSLALVWSFRQLLTSKPPKLRIRDGFYKGMYPLFPVILVLFVLGLQLIPMAVGGILYDLVITNGIAVGWLETVFWLSFFALTILSSLVLITPTLFALYIVSLPNMTPIKALRTAKKLVKFRRLTVLRKVVFLPVLILVPLCLILLAAIGVIPGIAQWIFFVLSIFILPAFHAYMYTLYRELLNE